MTDIIQIDDQIRPATADEQAQIDADRQAAEARKAQAEAQQAAKQSARQKLAAVGLTEDEIDALIGV